MNAIRLAVVLALTVSLQGCASLFASYFAGGLLAAIAIPSYVGAQDKARDASVRANVNTLRLGLEQWAVDNNGTYPVDLMAMVRSKGNYMPGRQLPPSPWGNGRFRQANMLTVADAPVKLNGPNDPAGPSPVGTVLGPGKVPTGATFDATTYGAILYDHEPKEEKYLLYGIGKKQNKAVVVYVAKNY
jgi:type II secretory pathway pseudopilin PulG